MTASHIMTHLKQSCWLQHWPVVDSYHSFWASWWASASRCDSGSCPPHTLHICPLVCKSRPPCRSLHAVRGKGQRQSIKSGQLCVWLLHRLRLLHWENDAMGKRCTHLVWSPMMTMMHIGNTPRHNRNVAKTPSSWPATIKVSTLCPRWILRHNNVCVCLC